MVALALAIAAAVGVFMTVKPDQETTAQVLIVPPATQPGASGKVNPFFSLGSSTQVMTTVIQSLTEDDRVVRKLAGAGDTATYQIVPNLSQNAGPTLIVTTTDKSPVTAQRTLEAVLGEMKAQLRTLQINQGVSEQLLITSIVLTHSPQPSAIRKSQIQLSLTAAVLVLLGLLLLILLHARRQVRKAGTAARHPEPPTPSAGSGRAAAAARERHENGHPRPAKPTYSPPQRVAARRGTRSRQASRHRRETRDTTGDGEPGEVADEFASLFLDARD